MTERKYEDLYRILVREMEEYAIFVMEVDGTILTWNAGVARILGYQEDEESLKKCSFHNFPGCQANLLKSRLR